MNACELINLADVADKNSMEQSCRNDLNLHNISI